MSIKNIPRDPTERYCLVLSINNLVNIFNNNKSEEFIVQQNRGINI